MDLANLTASPVNGTVVLVLLLTVVFVTLVTAEAVVPTVTAIEGEPVVVGYDDRELFAVVVVEDVRPEVEIGLAVEEPIAAVEEIKAELVGKVVEDLAATQVPERPGQQDTETCVCGPTSIFSCHR